MSKSYVAKKHLFDDCTNLYPNGPEPSRMTDKILGVTCGQCKGRILNVLRDRDWSLLEDDEARLLEIAAGVAAKQK